MFLDTKDNRAFRSDCPGHIVAPIPAATGQVPLRQKAGPLEAEADLLAVGGALA